MLPKGKSHVAAILLRLKRDKHHEREKAANDHEEDEEPSGDPGLESAMEDFAKALEARDYAGMAKAFKDAKYMCGDDDDDGEGEPEGED